MLTLGIDTSCYRTSFALVQDGVILADVRKLLEVPLGGRGLRQSEALFQHVGNMGKLAEEAFAKVNNQIGSVRPDAVCVSSRPRPQENSYMPVFTAGETVARSLAAAMNVPLFLTSHQQGHLRAALVDSALVPDGDFLAMHLSGGTTEVLRCSGNLESVDLLGATTDLHAGQLVDRIGVALGLGFPSGPMLEEMAGPAPERPAVPTVVKGLTISFSGAENQLKNMITAGRQPAEVAAELYSFLERSFAKLIANAREATGLDFMLIAGGVAASKRMREGIARRLQKKDTAIRLYWARPELSGDNAVGVALIGEDTLKRNLSPS